MKIWLSLFSLASVIAVSLTIWANGAVAGNVALDAEVTRVTAPRKLEIGKSARVSVEVVNEGYADWSKVQPKLIADIYSGPSGRGANLPELVEFVETRSARHSGDRWTFQYQIKGPKAPGVYELAWQMGQKGRKFGKGKKQKIEIFGTDVDAKIHEGDIRYSPNPVKPGKSFRFQVVVNNVGDVPFSVLKPTLRAKSIKPSGSVASSLSKGFPSRLYRPSGKKWTFKQMLQAPKTPGKYLIRWQMYRGSSAFGESADKTIEVK